MRPARESIASTPCTPRPVMPPAGPPARALGQGPRRKPGAPGHAAGGHLVAVLAPVLAAKAVRARPAEIAFDMEQLSEPAVLEHALDFAQRRLEAPVVADGERHIALGAFGGRALAFGARQAERLLHEHVLAGPGRGADLLGVRRMRRGENHGVDAFFLEKSFVRIGEPDAVAGAKVRGPGRRPRGARRE